MRLTLAALKSPYTVIVAALMLAAIGVFALPRMATDLLPQFRTPAVQVLTLYPGMPAPVVEADITSRLERWTGQSNGISRQVSRSLTGVSVVRNYFREDIDPNTAMSQVSALPVEIDVPNEDGTIVAGVRAEVRLNGQTREDVLVIPSEALLQEGAQTVVYVADSGVARRRVVRAAYDNGVHAEIQEGVTEGEVVLVGGRGLLRDGVRVEVAR